MSREISQNWSKIFLYLSFIWLTLIFLFNPHFIESTQVLDNWFTAKGLILYKDIAEFHFPLGRWILLPLHLITNWNLQADPFIALFTGIITLLVIYLFGKRFLSPTGTTLSLIFFNIFFWYFATNISFFHEMLNGFIHAVIILVFFTLFDEKKISNKKLFLLGLLFSLSLLVGQIAILTIATEFLLTLAIIFSKSKKIIIKPFIFLCLGTGLPILAISSYFIFNNAFFEFFHWNIIYYFQQYAYHPKSDFFSLPLKELTAFYIPLILLLIFIVKDLINKKILPVKYIYIFLLAASTAPFVFFSIFHFHHCNFALPILSLTFGLSFEYCLFRNSKIIFLAGVIIILFVLLSTIIPWHQQRFISPSLKIYNDTFPGEKMYEPTIWVRQNTSPETKILVIGDPLFYFRSDRLPSARPSKGLPHGWEPFPEVKREILAKPAGYLIISEQFMNRLKYDYTRIQMVDFIEKELKGCYKQQVEFDDWQIYKRICQ